MNMCATTAALSLDVLHANGVVARSSKTSSALFVMCDQAHSLSTLPQDERTSTTTTLQVPALRVMCAGTFERRYPHRLYMPITAGRTRLAWRVVAVVRADSEPVSREVAATSYRPAMAYPTPSGWTALEAAQARKRSQLVSVIHAHSVLVRHMAESCGMVGGAQLAGAASGRHGRSSWHKQILENRTRIVGCSSCGVTGNPPAAPHLGTWTPRD